MTPSWVMGTNISRKNVSDTHAGTWENGKDNSKNNENDENTNKNNNHLCSTTEALLFTDDMILLLNGVMIRTERCIISFICLFISNNDIKCRPNEKQRELMLQMPNTVRQIYREKRTETVLFFLMSKR